MPIYNTKCGIDVTFSGVDGTDYAEEYYYHSPLISDAKTVWIKSGTMWDMRHNTGNVGAIQVGGLNGRKRTLIGTGIGYTGTWASGAVTGGGGIIRYTFDRMWDNATWGGPFGTPYPAYSGSFAMSGSTYTGTVPVVGTTGGNIANTASPSFYWRGMTDSVGDEWHVFKYADDDGTLGSANDDSWSSDGKWFMTVVNPKTPCLTVRTGAAGTGQFYTTPPYVYFMQVIRDQTTYFQGNCDFNLRDINGNNIFYSINSGGYVNAGAATVTLNQTNFTNGNNTLQYYYAGNAGFVRQRNVVKNPSFPSSGESHGNLLWGNQAGYDIATGRAFRSPYYTAFASLATENQHGQAAWNTNGGQGYRLGGDVAAYRAGPASTNAFLARLSGWNATLGGSTKTFAQYAKEMTIEQAWTTPNLGFELSMADVPMASAELNYRGYWDVDYIYGPIIAYDILMSGYRSDQHPSGITPVEDYFVRDTFANYVHYCSLWLGGHQALGDPAMWGTARNVGATLVASAMPTYSTPYFGTCGLDGNTGTYQWASFPSTGYTWNQLYLQATYPTGLYPNYPVYYYGWTGSAVSLIDSNANWIDRYDYTVAEQMGHNMGLYRNLVAQYSPLTNVSGFDNYLNKVTTGTAIALKAPTGFFRRTSALVLNNRWQTPAVNAQAWCQGLPPTDDESEDKQIINNGTLLSFAYYDDTWFGVPSGATLHRLGRCLKLKGYAFY